MKPHLFSYFSHEFEYMYTKGFGFNISMPFEKLKKKFHFLCSKIGKKIVSNLGVKDRNSDLYFDRAIFILSNFRLSVQFSTNLM